MLNMFCSRVGTDYKELASGSWLTPSSTDPSHPTHPPPAVITGPFAPCNQNGCRAPPDPPPPPAYQHYLMLGATGLSLPFIRVLGELSFKQRVSVMKYV